MTSKDLFAKDATVEYRPVPTLDGGAQWHWVLFNPMDKVLGGGTASSRGKAGVQSRRKARQLRRKIKAVRVVGLVEGKIFDPRKFIMKMGNWTAMAERCGLKPTDDKFWAKATKGELICARTIESYEDNYTISAFAGEGNSKDGGLLVWVGVDVEANDKSNRFPLNTFLTTEKKLCYLVHAIEEAIYEAHNSWPTVAERLRLLRGAKGIIEGQEDSKVPQAPLPADTVRDYLIGVQPWRERFDKWSHGWGAREHMSDDPEMKKSMFWKFAWGFKTAYCEIRVYVFNAVEGALRSAHVQGNWIGGNEWHDSEALNIDGDMDLNELADHLEPVINQIEKWHATGRQPKQMEFVRVAADVLLWMRNHPSMSLYI